MSVGLNPVGLHPVGLPADAAVSGSHATSGALSAQAATVAGIATHKTLHTTSGALVSQAATIAGAALHPHIATGVLTSQAATIAGTADHTAGGEHATSGALVAQAATVAGTAAHLSLHTTSGALVAQAAHIVGAAQLTSLTPILLLGNLGWSDKPRKHRRSHEIEGLREELARALDEGKPASAPKSTPTALRPSPTVSAELEDALQRVKRRSYDGSIQAQMTALRQAIEVAQADAKRRERRRRQQATLLLL